MPYYDTSITDIAFKYQFNSQDVFTRAFNRLFGVTPAEYKRINKQTGPFKFNNNSAEVNTMFDLHISQKVQCTNNEKNYPPILEKILL